MKILTKIAIAVPLIAIALVLQANGTSTTQGNSAFKTGVSGCTNSAILACGGDCTNKLQFASIGCTNSALFAAAGCTNSLTVAYRLL